MHFPNSLVKSDKAMLKIKVCGLTDPANTKEIAAISPDFIGYIFYPGSKRFVGNKPADSLFRNISADILKTGVFVNEYPSIIIKTMKNYGLHLVQLHGNEPPEHCNSLKEEGLKVIKAFGISNTFNFKTLEQYLEVCDYFLFDAKTEFKGGSGLKFDWNILNDYNLSKPFFLGGGIRPEDSLHIRKLNHEKLFAVDINSCFEISPGIKDLKKVKDFINEIKG